MGMISRGPGPFTSIKRPRRNTTPRSYSLMTRKLVANVVNRSTTTTTKTRAAPPIASPSLSQPGPGVRARGSYFIAGGHKAGQRIHNQRKAILGHYFHRGADFDRLAVPRGHSPELTVDGSDPRWICALAHHGGQPQEFMRTGGVGQPPNPKSAATEGDPGSSDHYRHGDKRDEAHSTIAGAAVEED